MSGAPAPRRAARRRAVGATMSEIARMAGVSESTVSRALSGSPLVAEKTRERIVEIARTAKFSVNEQARSLAMGRTRTIEVIFPIEPGTLQHVSDPFFVDMLAALADRLSLHDYDALLTTSTPWDPERPGCAYLGGRADGVVFVGQGRRRSEIRDFARAHGKVVTWGAVEANDECCIVGSDNIAGGAMAAERLLALGRRAIAFLGDRTLPEIAQRLDGFARGHERAGARVDEALIVSAPFDIEAARHAADALIGLYPKFDAIVAASDMIALAAVAALRDKGLRVPEDVSVIGFDGIPAGAHVSPSLTTVRQDVKKGADVLVSKLLATLSGQAVSSTTLPVELIVRRSCA